MIEIDGNELYQWDTGRRVVVTGIEVEHVHFANQGDSKAVIMGAVDIHAQIPDFLLQSGKQLCVYAVKDGITVESKTFYVKKRERPENYVYEEDQRNYIYELVTNAEEALESMWWAYQDITLATENANLATENANNSADRANLAAKNANETAYKAEHTAKNLMVIGSAKGNNIHFDDAIDQFFVGMRICGKTTQFATKGVQMIPMPYKSPGTTVAGVTFEEQADGSVKCTGTATSSAYYPLCGGFAVDAVPIPDWLVEGETYTISGGSTNIDVLLVLYKADGTGKQFAGAPQLTFVMPTGYSYFGIFLLCRNGSTASNTVYPMLNAGPVAADYEPYTGRKPSPNPDYPQELACFGDSGSIGVSVTSENETQSMTIVTPNGLRGIPVASGGNCTDANGQQWICDEIDLERGVYVQRVMQKTYDGSTDELWWTGINHAGYAITVDDMAVGWRQNGYCDRFQVNSTNDNSAVAGIWFGVNNNGLYVHDVNTLAQNVDAWKAWLSENSVTIQYILAAPIETPLPAEDLTAYAALRTYRGNTTVSNDASAHMEIEYAMDAKTYISRVITGITSAARVVNISLPASKWAGSGNLYSQGVSIDGITENSQVNLTPSVEQLAIFYEKDVTFVTENDGGVVTVYVIGQKPTNDYTIMASIVEVIA